jgi:hypothetical protein
MSVALLDRPRPVGPLVRPTRGVPVAPAPPVGWAPAVAAQLRRSPGTAAYLLVLAATTAVLAASDPHAVHRLVASASTNLHNMTSNPLRVLVASAFWVETTSWIWPMALLVAAVMGAAERLLGLGRTLAVFVAGHVGATLVTVAVIGIGVDHGLLPRHLAYALDVGPSYGLAALGGALAMRTPADVIAVLLAGLGTALLVDSDFTDAGHLVAAVIGLSAASRAIRAT